MNATLLVLVQSGLGTLGMLAAAWVFVEVLNGGIDGLERARWAAAAAAALFWLEAAAIAVAHGAAGAGAGPGSPPLGLVALRDELLLGLVLIATYLPVAVIDSRLMINRSARRLVMSLAALIVVYGLGVAGLGRAAAFSAG